MPPSPMSAPSMSAYEREILDTLLASSDPRDVDDGHYLIDRGVRILSEPLFHVGAAYDVRNPKIIRVDSGVLPAVDRAACVVHEIAHLRQGVPRCFFLSSEVEAWQRQWRFSKARAGKWWWEGAASVEAAILFEEFVRLPLSPWEYFLPLGMRLRWFGRQWLIHIDPWRVEEETAPENAFPLLFVLLNEYAESARRTMKACDAGYLANLLFPWPTDFLANPDFWKDVREGFARVRKH